jgi:hypothetical protein
MQLDKQVIGTATATRVHSSKMQSITVSQPVARCDLQGCLASNKLSRCRKQYLLRGCIRCDGNGVHAVYFHASRYLLQSNYSVLWAPLLLAGSQSDARFAHAQVHGSECVHIPSGRCRLLVKLSGCDAGTTALRKY